VNVSANRLQEKTWSDVAAYLESDNRIILPVGSTEQHGVFSPLGTDTYVALTLSEDSSEKTGVFMAPPLWFGWSPHHLVRPGTISIRAEVLIEVLFDMIQSLSAHGFKRFCVVNGHRIVNIAWMQIAAERAQRELKVKVVLFDPAYMSKEIHPRLGFGPIGHAEDIETSHMMYRYPDFIDLGKAVDNPHRERLLYHLDPNDPRDTLCYVPATREDLARTLAATGDCIGGSPSNASTEKGKAYHDHLVARLVEVLAWLKNQ
jgi:creatinine amidohydrolase